MRSTEELMKIYREQSALGSDMGRGLDVMKRLTSANTEVTAMSQVVSALRDAECSADTLSSSIAEAREAGIQLPTSVDRMCAARRLMEHSAACRWPELLADLQSDSVSRLFREGCRRLDQFPILFPESVYLEVPQPGAAASKSACGRHGCCRKGGEGETGSGAPSGLVFAWFASMMCQTKSS